MSTQFERMRRRAGVAMALLTPLVLLATACGGSNAPGVAGGGSSSPSRSASAGAVAYSACMRSHGVPNFRDPDSSGHLQKTNAQQLGVTDSRLRAAQRACQHLYPTSSLEQCSETGVCSPADRQELLNRMREFAQCMRGHGVPDFPGPTTGADGAPYFDLLHLHSIDARSQAFEHKSRECFPKLGGVNIHVDRPG